MNSDLDQGLVSPTRSFVEDASDADGPARTEEEITNPSERRNPSFTRSKLIIHCPLRKRNHFPGDGGAKKAGRLLTLPTTTTTSILQGGRGE